MSDSHTAAPSRGGRRDGAGAPGSNVNARNASAHAYAMRATIHPAGRALIYALITEDKWTRAGWKMHPSTLTANLGTASVSMTSAGLAATPSLRATRADGTSSVFRGGNAATASQALSYAAGGAR